MRPFLDEFRKFILRGNVVDLAVGVVIGAAFGKIVDSLVADVFMPVVGVLTGGFNVEGMHLTLYGDAVLRWGKFLQAVINFVIIGFCMFLVVKGVNALHQHLLKQEAAAPPPEPSPTEKLLAEIRDLLKEKPDSLRPGQVPHP
ncbi:MAG: large-conductance mechanosensitive channel protein MscL [Gemmataceae bacterium]